MKHILFFGLIQLLQACSGFSQEVVLNDILSQGLSSCELEVLGKSPQVSVCGNYISSYYIMLDSVEIRSEHERRRIFLLSPIHQHIDDSIKCDSLNAKRLILSFIEENGMFKLECHSRVLVSRGDYSDEPYEKISSWSDGFILEYSMGTARKFYFKTYYMFEKAFIKIKRIEYQVILEGEQTEVVKILGEEDLKGEILDDLINDIVISE